MPKRRKKQAPKPNKKPHEQFKFKFGPLEIEIDQITIMAIIALVIILAFTIYLVKM
jgi:hypothetical protein